MPHRLGVAFLWHFHQPIYRGADGAYRLPWVYLHAWKDYGDMAAHLERHPEARVTVNWTPTLIEQLEDYHERLRALLREGTPCGDELLDALAGTVPLPASLPARQRLVQLCQRGHAPTLFHPHEYFRELLNWLGSAAGQQPCERVQYVNDQCLIDLLVWYHLAWAGASVRAHPTVQRLIDQRCGYTRADRLALVEAIAGVLGDILPRYRRLAEAGQVELSVTPYAHPIAPLLLDFAAAAETRPEDPLPGESYPGGEARLRWHIDAALACFERVFGFRPVGVWPAEGAVSAAALRHFAEAGFVWCASGERVWANSARASCWDEAYVASKRGLYAPVAVEGLPMRLLFRDDGLSDLIGFEYQRWDPDYAADHFVAALEQIARSFGEAAGEHTVLVALDGENAWEYYPNNGWEFLERLYARLSAHPLLRLRSVREAVAARAHPDVLTRVLAGSWVYGTLATWVGSSAKNRAWEALIELKKALDARCSELDDAIHAKIEAELAICESSDWFWWFNENNQAQAVAEFDALLREHLMAAYRLAGLVPPEALQRPFVVSAGTGRENIAMLRAG